MKKLFLILSSLLLVAGCSNKKTTPVDVKPTSDPTEISHVLKTRVAQSDPIDEQGKTGLLVYGYNNGDSLQLSTPLNGVFKTSLRPITNEAGNKDLKEFSIIFTETITKEQFAIKVFSFDTYSYVAINYKGQTGGINYYESEWIVAKECGFSGIANNEGHYTYLKGTGNIDLLFNPTEMVVQTKLRDNAYYNVWDFKRQNNDGKVIENNIGLFEEYNVSIVFDSIAANGCGNLLIYNFAGMDLSTGDIYNDKPIINTHINSKAVVGQEYEIPAPTVYSSKEGQLDSNNIAVTLYNKNGDTIPLTERRFTPTEKGDYYIYYLYSKDGVESYTYEKLTVLGSEEVNVTFSDFYLPVSEGQGKIIMVPDVSVTTNLGVKTENFSCFVTIKHNGEVFSEYNKVKTGFAYTFAQTGTYTFVYGCDVTSATKEQSVVIDQRLVVNGGEDVVYHVGENFELPDVQFVKYGRNVSYVAKVKDPFGNEMSKVPFVIQQEGVYTISYTIAAEINPIEKEITVKSLTASQFDDEDAVSERMVTDNTLKGVKLTLKNNKVVTYNKVIDLNMFGFDESKADKSQNPEIIKLYAQPNIQGRADLEALYIQITDVHDSNNFVTIRLRYIEQGNFHSGSMLRARANGQSSYVGYYYDFYTTERHVDNAMSHEEGGFITYFNFTHQQCGEQYKDMGLPLYFDYKSGKLYSRPAWLHGHNYVETDPYNAMEVPWLAYNFKSDDSALSGGNIPWKGFKDGKVKISIYGKGIGSTASIFVTSIGGEALDKELITDAKAPNINIDKKDITVNAITGELETPRAKCNSRYNLFPFSTEDETSSIKYSAVKVLDPSDNEVAVTDNSFTPTMEGEYKVVYETSDVFNNVNTLEVKVHAYNDYVPLSLTVSSALPTEMVYGSTLTLPTPTYEGGSGNLKFFATVTNEEGKEVAIKNHKITANVPGQKYTVTYNVEDYVGQRKTLSFDLNVNLTNDIIFDPNTIVLPTGFIHKVSYTFNSYYGIIYDSNYQPAIVPAKITCTDANGTKVLDSKLTYSPACDDSVTNSSINISFTHGTSVSSFNYVLPISKPVTGSSYISSYFSSRNAVVTPRQSDLLFESDGSTDMSFEFLKPINCNELLLVMGLNLDKIDASNFSISLRDMYNANEQIKLRFEYKDDPVTGTKKLYADLNKSNNFVNYNIGSSKTLCVDFASSTNIIKDTTGSEIFKVDSYLDGTVFDGFSSDNVYFSFEANDISSGDFEIQMQKINNQGINAIRNDFEKPIIYMEGDITNRVSRGSEIVVPKATASDVLNNLTSLKVIVTDPNGNSVLNDYNPDHEERFVASICGAYVVTYTAIDSKGNKAINEYYITSYDEVSPELTFNGSIPQEASVGSTISLPSYSIVDNEPSTCTVRIFVYNPDGSNIEVTNNQVSFPTKGVYVITYIVSDINNNVRHYVFTVTVK